DLPEGEYRATLVKNPGLSLAVGATRELNVTATDMLGEADADPVEGNFIDQSASGDLSDLAVTSVSFNGEPSPVVAGEPTTVTGDYGVLLINADGTYPYAPSTELGSAGSDSFSVVVQDTATGDEVTANLSITVS